MTDLLLQRIPMVAGIAYIERVRRLPSSLTVTLQVEGDNRYFPQAIAVVAGGEKIGYVAPEIARRYHASLAAHPGTVNCPARWGGIGDHNTSGIELLLDFSGLPIEPAA